MLRALATAATGMEAQQTRLDVTANNIANVNTPGFAAQRVEFEGSLARAIDRSGPSRVSIGATAGEAWMSLNGNQVSLEAETTTLVKSNLHYEAIVGAVNARFGLLGTAIGVR